jgi:hypothetical protein
MIEASRATCSDQGHRHQIKADVASDPTRRGHRVGGRFFAGPLSAANRSRFRQYYGLQVLGINYRGERCLEAQSGALQLADVRFPGPAEEITCLHARTSSRSLAWKMEESSNAGTLLRSVFCRGA